MTELFRDALARFLRDGQAKADSVAVFTAALDTCATPDDETNMILVAALMPVLEDPEAHARLTALVIAFAGMMSAMAAMLGPPAGLPVEAIPMMMASAIDPVDLLRGWE